MKETKRLSIFLRWFFSRLPILILLPGLFALKSGPAWAFSCDPWVAKLVSVEGEVTARDIKDAPWKRVSINTTFCPGESIQVGKNSRAAVRLSDHSLVRLDAQTLITFTGTRKTESFWMELVNGIGHFISRVPRRLSISTPFLDAKVEGTEFIIRVEQNETFLTVFEGQVAASNKQGVLKLRSGQSAISQPKGLPEIQHIVRPRDAVQWALYYPAILQFRRRTFEGGGSESWQARAMESIEFFKQGELTKAFDTLPHITTSINDARFFTYRASLRLAVGQVDGARFDLGRALLLNPDDGDAMALQAVIAVVQNDRKGALILAKKALSVAPNQVGPKLAFSYALQADFKLEAAREVLEKAVKQGPANALAWSRLAELRLMFRDLDGAVDAASVAVAIDSRHARTQTVLGFAHLIQIDTEGAKEAFMKAITLDQGGALQRLGMGLAQIREGNLTEGRNNIETAAMLNPSHALIRSYLGKAYYEEKRDDLAADQYQMASDLDPNDPTPDLYSAILNQTHNRPIEALEDIEKSIASNENRAVYRSRLLLDDDHAARSSSLARIYDDLGFKQLALIEGWKSLSIDLGNHSAHRFLADSYAVLPRHEIARVSELLQSQLLQPLNLNAIQPQLAETNLSILEGAGPSDAAFNEFNPLFVRNRTRFQTNMIGGNNSTLGEDLVVSGLSDRFSYSLGQYHYETDGFRENNDLKQDIYNVFGQVALSHRSNLQLEFRKNDQRSGDLRLRFDRDNFSSNRREKRDKESGRVGYHYAPSPNSDWIVSSIYERTDFIFNDSEIKGEFRGFPIVQVTDRDQTSKGFNTEVQYLTRGNDHRTVFGGGYYENDVTGPSSVKATAGPFELVNEMSNEKNNVHHSNLYAYLTWELKYTILVTVGASADDFDSGALGFDKDQINPKVGITWPLFQATTLRLAGFRTLKRSLVSNQTLEPTHVAGFNQFFDDATGTDAEHYGLGLDQKINKHVFIGMELSKRDLTVPINRNGKLSSEEQLEQSHRAYLYWTPLPGLALGVEYQIEKFDRDKKLTDIDEPSELTTQRIPLTVNYFHPRGLFVKWKTQYTKQEIELVESGLGKVRRDDDNFWVVDAQVGYRFPKRRGIVSILINNLFDKTFKFHDVDFRSGVAKTPTVQPERIIYLKISLTLD